MYDPHNPTMPQDDMTPEEARHDLKQFLSGPPSSPYFDRWHPFHEEAIAAVRKLHQLSEDIPTRDGTPVGFNQETVHVSDGDLRGLGDGRIVIRDAQAASDVQTLIERAKQQAIDEQQALDEKLVIQGGSVSGSSGIVHKPLTRADLEGKQGREWRR